MSSPAHSPRPPAAAVRQLVRPSVDVEVVIPARDEEGRLAGTLQRTAEYLASRSWRSAIVVVDNGSVDRTTSVADRFSTASVPVHILGCGRPGKGAAIRRGFMTSSARFVGFMDADLATPVDTLDTAMALLEQGYAGVVASRRALGARYVVPQSLSRRMGGAVFRAVGRRVVPGLQDTQCGFKFFNGPLVRDILAAHRTIDGFAFDLSLLRVLAMQGHQVVEVPVAWTDGQASTVSPTTAAKAVVDAARLLDPRGV
jgi:glycosyltransferase involved in cell wall biosynthesis